MFPTGISSTDPPSLIGKLYDVLDLLKGKAVQEFKRFVELRQDLARHTDSLRRLLDDHLYDASPTHKQELEAMEKRLRQFSSKVKALEPYLGHHNRGGSELAISHKIIWPHHQSQLQEMYDDFMNHDSLLSTSLQSHSRYLHQLALVAQEC